MPRLWIVPALLAIAGPVKAQDAFDLLKYIPSQANTVAVINTANILASPRAQKENWAKMESTEYMAGAVPLNPLVDRMLIARELNPESPGVGGTMAVINANIPIELDKLAKRIGGRETTIGDEPAVLSPTGVYYVKLGEKLLGTVRSDNKQEIARWLRYVKTAKESQLHRRLNAAVAASKDHHLTVAIDTEEMFDEHEVDIAAALAQSIQTDKDQAAFVVKFFKKLRGVVFTANITNEGIMSKVRLDSGAMDVKLDPEFVKAFVMETMNRHGAMLQDMSGAKMTKGDSSVTFTFQVSDAELGKIMGLALPPAGFPSNAQTLSVAPDKPNAQATLKYFNSVNAILDDLKTQNKKANDYSKTALWHDTAANKIEALSIIGVDKKVVEYGIGTMQRLHTIADSLRGVPAKVDELAGDVYALGYMPRRGLWGGGGGRINPWAYGNANVQTNAGEIYNKQKQVIKDDEKNRDKLWSAIDGKRSETRGLIADVYKVVPPEKK